MPPWRRRLKNISIHAPHEGERLALVRPAAEAQVFQSTLPTRGSDAQNFATPLTAWAFQSTLPTRGSDVGYGFIAEWSVEFQSTLPTRGSDKTERNPKRQRQNFNPRSPRGGATGYKAVICRGAEISIHAPHEGERLVPCAELPRICADFNPRSPRGGATDGVRYAPHNFIHFNPRSPRGGATHIVYLPFYLLRFQSTLPTRGSDSSV